MCCVSIVILLIAVGRSSPIGGRLSPDSAVFLAGKFRVVDEIVLGFEVGILFVFSSRGLSGVTNAG